MKYHQHNMRRNSMSTHAHWQKKYTKPNVNITCCADCTVGSNAMHALDDILAARNEYTMWWHSFSFGFEKDVKKETENKTKKITELCSTAFTGINKKYIPVPLEMHLFSSIDMWFLPRNCKMHFQFSWSICKYW